MQCIAGESKRGKDLCNRYSMAVMQGLHDLGDVYGRYSNRKESAYQSIKHRMENEGGYGLAIISHSGHTFTTAYKCEGNLIVDTKDNTYVVQGAY